MRKNNSKANNYVFLTNELVVISVIFTVVSYNTQFANQVPHLLRSGSALKTGRRVLPRSIPDLACRPSCSEFSVVFSKTRLNTG